MIVARKWGKIFNEKMIFLDSNVVKKEILKFEVIRMIVLFFFFA